MAKPKTVAPQVHRNQRCCRNHPVVKLACDSRTRIAEQKMRKHGGTMRPDVLIYCKTALELFATMPREKVQAIAFEIAILGQNGLDINTPATKYRLKELPANSRV
jgi:hypothetical protein